MATIDKVLVVNSGSSSLKYMLFSMKTETMLCKGLVERIGIEGSRMKHAAGEKKTVIEEEIPEKKYDDDFSYDDLYGKDEPEADTDQKYHSCPSCGTELTALKKDFDRCPYCGEKLTTNDLDKPKNEGEN